MADRPDVSVRRVVDEAGRGDVIGILAATYMTEKRWVSDPAAQFPLSDLDRDDIAWFVARTRGKPVGVVRIFRDPPVAAYAKFGFKSLDASIRVEDLLPRSAASPCYPTIVPAS